jgi:tRNA A-37 threonylcarbamoyl transferase component Bud32
MSWFMTVARHIQEIPEGLLQNPLVSSTERISFFRHAGKGYWVKRPERLSKLRRLQKGNAVESFQREVALLKQFREQGAAVVPIAAETAECIILPDMGPTLSALASTLPEKEFCAVLEQAGTALAGMHAAGLAHGRPRLRDICWTGTSICFLDLEAGAQLNAPGWRQALDLLLMVHSVFQNYTPIGQHVPDLLRAYERAGQQKTLALAKRLARRFAPLRILVAPVAARDKRNGKRNSEAAALIAVFNHLR